MAEVAISYLESLSAANSPANITFESGPPVFTKNSFFCPFTVAVILKVDEKPEPPCDWISGDDSCNERASMIAGSIFDTILYLALGSRYKFAFEVARVNETRDIYSEPRMTSPL